MKNHRNTSLRELNLTRYTLLHTEENRRDTLVKEKKHETYRNKPKIDLIECVNEIIKEGIINIPPRLQKRKTLMC